MDEAPDGLGIPGSPDGPPEIDPEQIRPVIQGTAAVFRVALEEGLPFPLAFELARDFFRTMNEALAAAAVQAGAGQ
jgi:hypothetical protein